MKKILTLLWLTATSLGLYAQSDYVRVYFVDKGSSEQMLAHPEEFLSGRAIWRRAKQNIAINSTDLPLAKEYVQAVLPHVKSVEARSKWLNSLLVRSDQPELLEKLSFVRKVERVYPVRVQFADRQMGTNSLNYGTASNQTEMLLGDELHDFGFTGSGMHIAVIDGGFFGALPSTPGFDSLYARGQILGTYDFVQNDTDVYDVGSHGTQVLAVMGGFLPNQFLGSAPDASYWLLKSENEISETTVEMDQWVMAAEFADSVGVDVINSSLGYTTFDQGVGNLEQSDMDGNTAIVTIGADMAAKKGILVVVSAGNSGGSSWPIIGAPADGDSVLTVGGVDSEGEYVSFSSTGPTADGRIKPTVVAQAFGTASLRTNGTTRTVNGTSFSSPIIAGLAACLWQSQPSLSNMDIYEAIRKSSSLYYTPSFEMGFGIPNFAAASYSISLTETEVAKRRFDIYPNPIGDLLHIQAPKLQGSARYTIRILDMQGREAFSLEQQFESGEKLSLSLNLKSGNYLLLIQGENFYQSNEISLL